MMTARYPHAMAEQLAIIDPSGRLIAELAPLAAGAGLAAVARRLDEPTDDCTAVLVAPSIAGELG